MLPRLLYLTWHGLGAPSAPIPDDVRRYWHSEALFEETLSLVRDLERESGIDVRFTFDDGNQSDHSIGYPRLMAHGRIGIVFVCAGWIGKPGFLDAAQLRELVAGGMQIGCHGYDHLNWREADDSTLRRELDDARAAIEDVIGQAITSASTPFGALDRRAADAAKEAGFTSLFTSSGGFAVADHGLVPRNSIRAGFNAVRDLPQLAAWSARAQAAVYDRARRAKYGFY